MRQSLWIFRGALELLPLTVTDPVGLVIQAEYDYRVLQPRQVTDPNDNRQRFTFTPLGLLASVAVMGKAGEAVGDTAAVPGTRLVYDLLAFIERGQPISVRTIQREHHVNDTAVPLPERDAEIESIEYSDGFGRLLQTRTQAEDQVFGALPFGGDVGLPADQALPVEDAVGQQLAPGEPPRVVVSGWQTYDNKGQVVEQYEPFYAAGWEYQRPTEGEMGQKVTMFYDPRGQVIRTVNPDGSEQRVIYGVPMELSNPDEFTPTPWEAYTYDANDLAPLSPGNERVPESHWFTPSSVVIDALGRTIEAVERNGTDPTNWYFTRSTYDIRDNLLTVTDTLEREAFRYVYDLANNPLRTESIDAGTKRVVLDALGNGVEQRDSKGALVLEAYDRLSRPTYLWARDHAASAMTLRQVLQYGDGGTPDQPEGDREAAKELNRLGQLVRHYDEAGRLALEEFDFKGNLLTQVRRVIADDRLSEAYSRGANNNWQIEAFRLNWQAPNGDSLESHAETLLNFQEYVTSMTYDALNRVTLMRYPEDVEGDRQTLRPTYNRAGALERVTLNEQPYVERIAYDAKGQRILIAYGNGVMTRYGYDPETFRLLRLRSDRYTQPNPLTYRPTGAPLQDFAYAYDLVGNITTIKDRTPDSGILNTPLGADALDRTFTYDPIYRLLTATGRECDLLPEMPPWDDRPRCVDLTRTRGYQEQYQYDPMGNILRLRHEHIESDGTVQGRNRNFTLVTDEASDVVNNRLASVAIGQTEIKYDYDDSGNLVKEGEARHFEWDYADQMKAFRTQTEGAEPSVYAQYCYDAAGQRVMKWVHRQGGIVDVTVYVDGMFEHHRKITVGETQENNTLHVMDDASRIALVRVGEAFPEDRTPAVKYHLGDHLGSSNVVVDQDGNWIDREEFTPYGETSFGRFKQKRYRFTGKERDEESGLNYHRARYYAPWLGRWINIDPAQTEFVEWSPFSYVLENPMKFIDDSGEQPELTNAQKQIIDQVGAWFKDTEKFIRENEDIAEVRRQNSQYKQDLEIAETEKKAIAKEMGQASGRSRRNFLRGEIDRLNDDIEQAKKGINKTQRVLNEAEVFLRRGEILRQKVSQANFPEVVNQRTTPWYYLLRSQISRGERGLSGGGGGGGGGGTSIGSSNLQKRALRFGFSSVVLSFGLNFLAGEAAVAVEEYIRQNELSEDEKFLISNFPILYFATGFPLYSYTIKNTFEAYENEIRARQKRSPNSLRHQIEYNLLRCIFGDQFACVR
ncbi:RHS repeat-associated core domain-containing protein [Nodosilinea sp. P-1105]|uniref:RHS repeat-associated core domain-containing protein n=1 Tax=Nodosilinea sp. P-1105 TaxID=2546229 RepID=UPI00146E26AF|nr:RHS repeat-associated core domain-containing protein [Nodosilinea sp. P-1105]NMF84102.1 hypothetical protein [Nodosilinea sp. P-1105]